MNVTRLVLGMFIAVALTSAALTTIVVGLALAAAKAAGIID